MPELSSGGVHRRSCGTGTPGNTCGTPGSLPAELLSNKWGGNAVGLGSTGGKEPWLGCGAVGLWSRNAVGRGAGMLLECGAGMLWDHGVAMLWDRNAVGLGSRGGKELWLGVGPPAPGALQCPAEERGEHRHKEGRHWQVQTLL